MKRKRKTNFPPPSSSKKRTPPAGAPESMERPNLAAINTAARAGQDGLSVGDKVRIEAAGLYSGEVGTIERLSAGAIPSAFVRTESGGLRQVRTIDLARTQTEGSGRRENSN